MDTPPQHDRRDQRVGGILAQAVDALRNALGERLIAVVLFGSRARGDAHEGSDWDLLVIAEGLPQAPFQRYLYLKQLLPPGTRGEVSIIARTRQEFEARLPSLYLDIATDGRILYDPWAYASQRLMMLRQLIQKAGLYRERTEAGDIWQWQTPPTRPWTLKWSS
ncbi:MAG: nucleotidyltransferase domain-containing protein [Chloroflexota bacterium]